MGTAGEDRRDGAEKLGLAEAIVVSIRAFRDNGIRAGLRTATAEGQGEYLFAMFVFGLAALAFHYAILPQTSRENRLEKTLSQRQESLAGERYPVLAGLVTQPSAPVICAPGSAGLRSQLDAIASAFASAVDAMPGSAPLPDLRPACTLRTANVGPIWTEVTSKVSTLFIPSTTAAQAVSGCNACPDTRENACVDRVAVDIAESLAPALRASQAIEEIPRALRRLQATSTEEYALRSIYFIATNGLVRSIDMDGDGAPSAPPEGVSRVDDYVPHLMYNGTGYFMETVARQGQDGCFRHVDAQGHAGRSAAGLLGFVTTPYFDSFGGGLVETFCRSVLSGGTLAGVLCVDIAHSERKVLESLSKLDAFDYSIVQISAQAKPEPSLEGPDERGLPEPEVRLYDVSPDGLCPLRFVDGPSTSVDLRNFAALYYRNRLIYWPRDIRKGGVFKDRCEGATECKFGVTLYKGTRAGKPYWDVAVVRLRRPRPRDYLALLICGVMFVLGLGALALGYRKKTRAREAYFIRGLPLGAVHVASSDQVAGGNDRAEAIFGRDLPRLTLHDNKIDVAPSTFSSFIDRRHCVIIGPDGRIDPRNVVSYDVVRWRCTDELTVAFYARVISRGWVRVTARVLIQPEQHDDLLLVVDTHICDEHRAVLDQIGDPAVA